MKVDKQYRRQIHILKKCSCSSCVWTQYHTRDSQYQNIVIGECANVKVWEGNGQFSITNTYKKKTQNGQVSDFLILKIG